MNLTTMKPIKNIWIIPPHKSEISEKMFRIIPIFLTIVSTFTILFSNVVCYIMSYLFSSVNEFVFYPALKAITVES